MADNSTIACMCDVSMPRFLSFAEEEEEEDYFSLSNEEN